MSADLRLQLLAFHRRDDRRRSELRHMTVDAIRRDLYASLSEDAATFYFVALQAAAREGRRITLRAMYVVTR